MIVLDPGHGGDDPGGVAGGRQEKDDNLALGLATKTQLETQGFRVVCTRSSDKTLTLAERAKVASDADADLFISLHRGYFDPPSEEAAGVAGFVYPTAALETSGKAAGLLLAALEEAGVTRVIGVSRGNHPILRRAEMPAILLEVGFVSSQADNQLFDQRLTGYAAAIAKGVTNFFGLNFSRPQPRPLTLSDETQIHDIQRLLDSRYGFGLRASGRFDKATVKAIIIALQIEMNGKYRLELPLTGKLEDALAAFKGIQPGEQSGLASLLQSLLILSGYEPGEVDGGFGPRTASALRMFQRDRYLKPSGRVGPKTLAALLQPTY